MNFLLSLLPITGVSILLLLPRLAFDIAFVPSDVSTHYTWAVQFNQALNEGHIYPRWTALENGGLGAPTFVYYAPLYFYFVSVLNWAFADVWTAMKAADFIANWGSGIATSLFCQRMGIGWRWTVLAAVTVQMAPFLMMLHGYINGLPWYFALPFCMAVLYFSFFGTKSDGFINIPLCISVALLAVTHILSAFMVLLTLPFLHIMHGFRGEDQIFTFVRSITTWAVSSFFGLALAAIYLWPALTTLDLISEDAWSRAVDWRRSFSLPILTLYHGLYWAIFQWGIAGSLFCCLIVVTVYLYRWRNTRDQKWLILLGLASIAWVAWILSSELSYPLWEHSHYLRKLQYPYRFCYVVSATILPALAITFALCQTREIFGFWRKFPALPLILCVMLTLVIEAKLAFLDGQPVRGFLTARITNSMSQPEYTTRSRGPKWQEYIDAGGFNGECDRQGLRCKPVVSRSQQRQWQVCAANTSELSIPVFAYPAWSVFIDNGPARWRPDRMTGLINVRVKTGCQMVELKWTSLAQEKIGFMVSLTALIGLGIVVFRRYLIRLLCGDHCK